MKRLLLLSLLIFSLALPAFAQDAEPTANCTDEALAELLTAVRAQLDSAESAGDVVAATAELDGIGTAVAALQAECSGLSFSGGDLSGEIIGPFSIPEGIYRLVLNGGANMSVETTIIEGDCDIDGFFYLPSEGGETETLVQSEGCTVLMQLDDADDEWSLWFEKIS